VGGATFAGAVAQASPEGLLLADRRGCVHWANPAAWGLLGSLDPGTPLTERLPEGGLADVLAAGTAWRGTCLTPDAYPLEVAVVPLGGGASVAVRPAPRPRPPDRPDRWRSIVGALRDAVVVHRPDGAVVACNPAATRLFGMPAADLARGGLAEVLRGARDPDGAAVPWASLPANRALAGHGTAGVRLRVDLPGTGPAVLTADAHPLPEGAGGGAATTYRRLDDPPAAGGDEPAGASCDATVQGLRTPLIEALAHLARLGRRDLDDPARAHLEAAITSVRRMVTTVDRAMDADGPHGGPGDRT
jgi:PAS domain-containing protein